MDTPSGRRRGTWGDVKGRGCATWGHTKGQGSATQGHAKGRGCATQRGVKGHGCVAQGGVKGHVCATWGGGRGRTCTGTGKKRHVCTAGPRAAIRHPVCHGVPLAQPMSLHRLGAAACCRAVGPEPAQPRGDRDRAVTGCERGGRAGMLVSGIGPASNTDKLQIRL